MWPRLFVIQKYVLKKKSASIILLREVNNSVVCYIRTKQEKLTSSVTTCRPT